MVLISKSVKLVNVPEIMLGPRLISGQCRIVKKNLNSRFDKMSLIQFIKNTIDCI